MNLKLILAEWGKGTLIAPRRAPTESKTSLAGAISAGALIAAVARKRDPLRWDIAPNIGSAQQVGDAPPYTDLDGRGVS